MREQVLSATPVRHVMCVSTVAREGVAILDTGATTSVVGRRWWANHCEWVRQRGRSPPRLEPAGTSFRFGNGSIATARELGTTELALGGDFPPFSATLLTRPLHLSCRVPLSRA